MIKQWVYLEEWCNLSLNHSKSFNDPQTYTVAAIALTPTDSISYAFRPTSIFCILFFEHLGVYCVCFVFFSHIIAMWNRITNTRTQSFSFLYNCACYTWKWATLPLKRFNCVIYYAIKIIMPVLKRRSDIDLRLRLRWFFKNLWLRFPNANYSKMTCAKWTGDLVRILTLRSDRFASRGEC